MYSSTCMNMKCAKIVVYFYIKDLLNVKIYKRTWLDMECDLKFKNIILCINVCILYKETKIHFKMPIKQFTILYNLWTITAKLKYNHITTLHKNTFRN